MTPKLSRLPRLNVAEDTFLFQWRLVLTRHPTLPEPERNAKFHPSRKWELDFAWRALKVALEIQGGIWISGAHARPTNIERDMEKHNALLDLGWRVYQFTPKQVKQGIACQHLERVLLCARRGELPCDTPTPMTSTTTSEQSPAASSGRSSAGC